MISIHDARRALAGPLPGVEAQLRFAPDPRPGWDPYGLIPATAREAAVLVLLYPAAGGGGLCFVLTERSPTLPFHRGQVSLPGGTREPGEALITTALRETREELGIALERVETLRELTRLFVPPSSYCIYPFVAYIPEPPVLVPEPAEVAGTAEVPLESLLDPALRKEESRKHYVVGLPIPIRVPYFYLGGLKVWGATAMILSELAAVLEAIPPANPR